MHNGTVQFLMFMLVRMLFGSVIGELEGVLWGRFTSDSIDQISVCTLCTVCSPSQNQKIKKRKTCRPSFFIRKVSMTGDLAISGLS